MKRLALFVALVALVAACDRGTAPRYTLGPGCTHSLPLRDLAVLKVHYADCTGHNIDSLEAVGWTITWDTVWHN